MRYITGSRMFRLGEAMSILARRHARAVRKLAGLHAREQIEIFFDRTIAIRAFLARLGQRAAIFADFVGAQVIHVSFAGLDQLHRPVIQLLEIIGGVVKAFPLEAEPLHVGHDGLDVLGLFLFRIGVVEAQVGAAAKFVCQAEVQADGLGMADVQISVRLGRKARPHAAVVLAGLQVFNNGVANKVGRTRRLGGWRSLPVWNSMWS